LPRSELAHLPSLRNQWGQAHVNEDLTSLSWIAIPPYSGGYRTGVLKVDDAVIAAESLKWSPWGVERWGDSTGISVHTDTRLGFKRTAVHWRIVVSNESDKSRAVVVEQELLAPIAHSEVDWGWLYGLPWNAGHHHDFFAIERIRSHVLDPEQRQVQLLPTESRWVRLGSPRIPGIQRDEEDGAMDLSSELPDHSTSDSGRTRAPAARARIRDVHVTTAEGDRQSVAGEYSLDDDSSEFRLDPAALSEGTRIGMSVLLASSADGVLLSHGNHPDSLQLGLLEGRPSLRIGGEFILGEDPLPLGEWIELEATVDPREARILVGGRTVASTTPWWGGQRWTASIDGGEVVITDSASPTESRFAFSTPPTSRKLDGQRGLATWELTLAPGESRTIDVLLQIGDNRDSQTFDEIAAHWYQLWSAAFDPSDSTFSGYLPILETADTGLSRTYYLGVLLALYLRNTGVSPLGPVFLTGGPRLGATTTFYWDQSEWARTAAMLDPVATRA
jgi:hypothetical protein